ncbi:HD-GYP domain-containing protein [Rhodoferax sp. PAMC 29310]|uniref:HD-GYP domain-containing protein n=1 Tax=Rhodoferax sp. PAMC 29310 TaxID=2822760 RepID=UPI001F0ABC0B|nr:HD domain-containing phosphohydrolase [Rhodoferax sp. PAMC 29310]
MRFVLRHTGPASGLKDRLKALGGILTNGDDIAQELIQTRCTRGADIARQLRFSEGVAQGIHSLDEHWNGQGRPMALQGDAIPVYARIALMSQVIDLINGSDGRDAALREVRQRSGKWFDPNLVDTLLAVAEDKAFWTMLNSPEVESRVFAMEPGDQESELDEDYLDDIAEAFGKVVDAKSPYTAGHSARVGLYTALLGESLGLPESRRRWLKRGALLHDMGKLGVSNTILDKPGKLDDAEWAAVRRHASYTQTILGQINIFEELARVSSAHHERLDGKGYSLGLKDAEIALETRIITMADIFDAITAVRPYRGAIPVEKTLLIMAETVGTAIDGQVFEHLKAVVKANPELFPE